MSGEGCDISETVLLCKALKYEAPAGPKQIAGAINRLADVPPTPLFAQLRDAAMGYAPDFGKSLEDALERGALRHHRYPTDTPPEGYPLARARSSSSSSSSSSTVKTVVADGEPPKPPDTQVVEQTRPDDDPIAVVFDAWRESTGKHRAQLDDKRCRKIKAALRAYPLPDVLDAVRGWANSPHHRGENEQGTVYNELTLLLRDAEHIEHFRDRWRAGPSNGPPGKATLRMVRTAQDMRAWAERMEGGEGEPTRVGESRPAAQRELPGPAG